MVKVERHELLLYYIWILKSLFDFHDLHSFARRIFSQLFFIKYTLESFVCRVCVRACARLNTNTLLHPQRGSPAHAIVGWGAGALSPSSGCDTRSVGRGSSLRNRQSSNHLHAITLRPPLSTPPPRFICAAPAGLTAEQFPGRAGGKYISLIKGIWWLFYMLSAHC